MGPFWGDNYTEPLGEVRHFRQRWCGQKVSSRTGGMYLPTCVTSSITCKGQSRGLRCQDGGSSVGTPHGTIYSSITRDVVHLQYPQCHSLIFCFLRFSRYTNYHFLENCVMIDWFCYRLRRCLPYTALLLCLNEVHFT